MEEEAGWNGRPGWYTWDCKQAKGLAGKAKEETWRVGGNGGENVCVKLFTELSIQALFNLLRQQMVLFSASQLSATPEPQFLCVPRRMTLPIPAHSAPGHFHGPQAMQRGWVCDLLGSRASHRGAQGWELTRVAAGTGQLQKTQENGVRGGSFSGEKKTGLGDGERRQANYLLPMFPYNLKL